MTQKKMLLILGGVLAILGIVAIVGYSSPTQTSESDTSNYIDSPVVYGTSEPETVQSAKEYGFGDTFDVGDFEITLGGEYTFATLQNKYSEENGRLAMRIPFTETNNGSTAGHYYMGLTTYNPSGHETVSNNAGVYFDDSNFEVGGILPGVTQTSYLYIIYDGDGQYTLNFDAMLPTETVAKLHIKR